MNYLDNGELPEHLTNYVFNVTSLHKY